MEEQRTHYRGLARDRNPLEVSVLEADGPSVTGRLIDGSLGGAKVRFARPGSPELVIDQAVQLRITSDLLKNPIEVSAIVRHRIDERCSRSYGFRFTNPEHIKRELLPQLTRLFNQSGAYRVQPSPEAPIKAALNGGDGCPDTVWVTDISGTGVGVRVDVELDTKFVMAKAINIAITLPNVQRVCFEGVICSRSLPDDNNGIHYSIAFDLEKTHDAQRQHDIVIDYVLQRQRENHQLRESA